MTIRKILFGAALAFGLCGAALADLTVGISLPLTGPANGLGIPMQNYIKLWPDSVAGEKLKVILLDDASDPTRAVQNARRFVTEDKVDVVMGSSVTVNAVAMADTVAESNTVQMMFSPAVLLAGKDHWAFRLPQGNAVMAHAVIEHMKKQGVKTVGFLGYTDAYGETWLNDFRAESAKLGGPQITAVERFARPDTSVTGQALKLVAANPDAILIVASGSGAAMPHKGVIERGYKGKIYQTHAAATRDLMRIGGKDVEGAFVVSGPAVVPEQLPDSHPSKKVAQEFVDKYEMV
jgi:branched-chain amino acid transport system substrate-binding protein